MYHLLGWPPFGFIIATAFAMIFHAGA